MEVNFFKAFEQLQFMAAECAMIVNNRKWRWLTMWFGGSACIVLSYRIDRMLFLMLGRSYGLFRILFFPLFLFLRMASAKHEIHYRAEIGCGLRVFHPNLGIVVSGKCVIGNNLTLRGGNCIGGKKPLNHGDVQLGNNVSLGVNAVVLGPVTIGDNCTIGAGAVVLKNAESGASLVGVPARSL